jgi:ferritin-like metal-binding protein YciE
MDSLKDVYLDQLQDLYSADKQAEAVTRELARAAKNARLRDALERGTAGIKDGREKLEAMLRNHATDPGGEHCKGMEGLVREARTHALEAEFGSDAARDAMIVTQYQRMAHYAIAGYGCAAAFAGQLGLKDEARTLKEMLDAAYSGDRTMTELAETQINEAAA